MNFWISWILTLYADIQWIFIRELKPGARPIACTEHDDVAVCAADSRLTAFKSFEVSLRFWFKVLSIALNICDVRATHLLEVVLVSAFAILIR